MSNEIIYSLNVEDLQTVALEELGRHLNDNEIFMLKDKVADNIPWFDAIAYAIQEVVRAN